MQFFSRPDYSIKEKSKAKQNKGNLRHSLAGGHIYSKLSGVFPNRRTKAPRGAAACASEPAREGMWLLKEGPQNGRGKI